MKCLQTLSLAKRLARATLSGTVLTGSRVPRFSNNFAEACGSRCSPMQMKCRTHSTFEVDDDVFGLTDDEKQFRRMVFQFAQKELDPQTTYEIDKTNSFPGFRDFVRKCGQLGLLGITCPAEYGGSEGSYMMQV